MKAHQIAITTTLCQTALFLMTAYSSAETLSVKVRDETSKGVPSEVYVYKTTNFDASNQILIGETNQDGAYAESHKCEASHVIRVLPKSRGEYFIPQFKPCKQEIIISVIHRQTPVGFAFNGLVSDVVLPDGSPGVIATWAYLDTLKTDQKARTSNGTVCDVTVRPRLDHKVFRKSGGELIPVAQGNTTASQVLAAFNLRDQYSAIFPSPCAQSEDNILALQNSTAAQIDHALTLGKFSNTKTFQMLNMQ